MGLVDDILAGYKQQLQADIARWDYPECRYLSAEISGEVKGRNEWHVDILFAGYEDPESQNQQMTLVQPVVSVVFQIPIESADRLRFHCSPDEDGLLAAIWRLTHDGRRSLSYTAPTVLADTEIWGVDDGSPAQMWVVEVQIAVAPVDAPEALTFGVE